MSGHGQHDADADSHAGHDDRHEETTSDDFPADEPRSPGWLPLLGGALLLAGIFGYMVFGSDAAVSDSAGPAADAPAAAAPATRPAPPIRPGAAVPPNHEQFVARPVQ
jgi:hypothetical protein